MVVFFFYNKLVNSNFSYVFSEQQALYGSETIKQIVMHQTFRKMTS